MNGAAPAGPGHRPAHPASAIAAAVELACVLEATAPKPGNVSPGRPFSDTTYEDFLASAAAVRDPMAQAGSRPLGDTVWLSIEATSRGAPTNTNLGIVLLLAPLARAAALGGGVQGASVDARLRDLRSMVGWVLAETTVEDARQVFRAIRQAKPGGLGTASDQDVSGEPTITLLEAMRPAAERDGIAREYATSFGTTFELSVPVLLRARSAGLTPHDGIVETFLYLVASAPDTHIVRRGGEPLARRASALARAALAAGGVRTDRGRRAIEAMDAELRDARHLGNPGTSADLTAAALFVAIIVGGWSAGHEDVPMAADREVS